MHIWPNILQSKDNQIMNMGQLKEVVFFKNHVEDEAERLVP